MSFKIKYYYDDDDVVDKFIDIKNGFNKDKYHDKYKIKYLL